MSCCRIVTAVILLHTVQLAASTKQAIINETLLTVRNSEPHFRNKCVLEPEPGSTKDVLDQRKSLHCNYPVVDKNFSSERRPPLVVVPRPCPPWFIASNSSCQCGSTHGGIVKCDAISLRTFLLCCYCMTYTTDYSNGVVGHCLLGCSQTIMNTLYMELPHTIHNLTNLMCGRYKRKGQLCGACQENVAISSYSFDLTCISCQHSNWGKYILVAFGPLTLFCILIIVLRINVNSGDLSSFVMVSQLLAAPPQLRLLQTNALGFSSKFLMVSVYAAFTFYGVWNLDFLRLIYRPFCLYPNMTMLEVMAMDYVIAVYPLALILVIYFIIKLYDKKLIPLQRLLRMGPITRLLRHCSGFHPFRTIDIRSSLIDAYATFSILSFQKFMTTSFDLLIPTQLFDVHGNTYGTLYVYYDGSIPYFGKTHLPYALLAVVVIFLFGVAPAVLALLFQCRCFHRQMQWCGIHCNTLHMFMDAFVGSYKDGTDGGRDCRYFVVVYLIVRVAMMMTYMTTLSTFYYCVGAAILAAGAFSVAMIQPYKNRWHQKVDIILITSLVVVYLLIVILQYPQQHTSYIALSLGILCGLVPIGYIVIFTTWSVFRWLRSRGIPRGVELLDANL